MPSVTAASVETVRLMVGLEVHVELATRTKMFTRARSPACPANYGVEPNALIDETVLALPGALPVMNRAAVEMAMMVGLALNCSIARQTKWDRKGYFYPDLPKSYQISQYDLPLCFDGAVDVPSVDERGVATTRRIGIVRAHLEEDAGKLLHELPGGGAGAKIDFSIADYNRAGTPLLEVVTAPDFTSADEVVAFARMLRNLCRFLGVSEGVMQRGHMRFEPNINCVMTLTDGTVVRTPVVEIKNLNSFKALRGAIEHERAEQPRRWQQDGRVMGPGQKVTRGWDDHAERTFVQREKEDAQDYRYFPDPDLPPVVVGERWLEEVRGRLPELPAARRARYIGQYGLGEKEADALVEERDVCLFYESAVETLTAMGVEHVRAGKVAANLVLQTGLKLANERSKASIADGGEPVLVHELGITAAQVAGIAKLREDGKVNNQAVEPMFVACCAEPGAAVEQIAQRLGVLIVRDDAALARWIEQVLAANAKVAEDVRGGKVQAVGRLVGEVMKLAGGQADAKTVREEILRKLGAG
ncbi:MAG: Asp-tRNA(Asn)/Glu-tRNA(Gln) amidotransferase subunit GatB [Planctomycetota bacterium]|nr:Asp-tRNA(Asn)/Glu-tRNA(Gln) amidotransferase subunit GatB [Planctomycetota bacterium]